MTPVMVCPCRTHRVTLLLNIFTALRLARGTNISLSFWISVGLELDSGQMYPYLLLKSRFESCHINLRMYEQRFKLQRLAPFWSCANTSGAKRSYPLPLPPTPHPSSKKFGSLRCHGPSNCDGQGLEHQSNSYIALLSKKSTLHIHRTFRYICSRFHFSLRS